ncbi:uncharacterized protein BX664DRAFT_359722 [Halteromyces radiatus]|uniref:uncharacterized protein n=1 Tax=Halteromyces radiatus TaxID=101107 RepID=UPI00221F839F|nr:uncharacterized protein BX664DRAFT_359722 [Halteromyces radiatus]KAI8086172.1 hypothetical protein BX664DRAFT_359722 [Halteromyces radiatus]
MTDPICFALLRNSIYQILHSTGFESSHGEPINVLTDIFGQYIQLLASSASTFAHLGGRSVASPWDIVDGLIDVQVTLDQLEEWLDTEQGQFLTPAWSNKTDPSRVLKDIVTNGRMYQDYILYQYNNQQYHQININRMNGNANNDDQPILTKMDHRNASLPDYIPSHMPSFPTDDFNGISDQQADIQQSQLSSNQMHTTQLSYPMTSLLPSSTSNNNNNNNNNHKPSSKKPNDNPFTQLVPFEESSLASGNGLSLTISSLYSKPTSPLQQRQQMDNNDDDDDDEYMEMAKKRRFAEVNGSMETTMNRMMERYSEQEYQQQQNLLTNGNRIIFQQLTQNEAAPGKTIFGTRDGMLDEIVHRIAPPIALARLSSPNLLLDTATVSSPATSTPITISAPTQLPTPPAPVISTPTENRRSSSPLPPPVSSKSIMPLNVIPPTDPSMYVSSQFTSSPSPHNDLKTSLPPSESESLIPSTATTAETTSSIITSLPSSTSSAATAAVTSASATSALDASSSSSSSSSMTPLQSFVSMDDHTNESTPMPNSSEVPTVKIPTSLAMLSARGNTNSIKKDKKKLSVKAALKDNNGLPKKKKKSRLSVDLEDNINANLSMSKPSLSTSVRSIETNSIGSTTTTTTITGIPKMVPRVDLPTKEKIEGNGERTPDTPRVRFKDQLEDSNKHQDNNRSKAISMQSSSLSPPVPPSDFTTPMKKKKKKKKHDQQMPPSGPTVINTISTAPTTAMTTALSKEPNSTATTKSMTTTASSFSSGNNNYSSTPIRSTPISNVAPIMLLPTPATTYYDTSETVRCICENPTVDYGTFMISCDKCLVWFHGTCVGIAEHDQVEEWICRRCHY